MERGRTAQATVLMNVETLSATWHLEVALAADLERLELRKMRRTQGRHVQGQEEDHAQHMNISARQVREAQGRTGVRTHVGRVLLSYHRWASRVGDLQDHWGRITPVKTLLEPWTEDWWNKSLPKYGLRECTRKKSTQGLRHGHAGKPNGWETPLVLVFGSQWRAIAAQKVAWRALRETIVVQMNERWLICTSATTGAKCKKEQEYNNKRGGDTARRGRRE